MEYLRATEGALRTLGKVKLIHCSGLTNIRPGLTATDETKANIVNYDANRREQRFYSYTVIFREL